MVTTSPDGIRYLVEHERTGLLCEPGDWRALAENVIRLLKDSEFALQMAQNAFAESKRYHWNAVRSQWLDVYWSLHGTLETRKGTNQMVEHQLMPVSEK